LIINYLQILKFFKILLNYQIGKALLAEFCSTAITKWAAQAARDDGKILGNESVHDLLFL
jgi:hypothetical protein